MEYNPKLSCIWYCNSEAYIAWLLLDILSTSNESSSNCGANYDIVEIKAL
nr:MAG TPA: hypothetical protein [Caudoviricetes sp.]